jgi:hypothetical protein
MRSTKQQMPFREGWLALHACKFFTPCLFQNKDSFQNSLCSLLRRRHSRRPPHSPQLHRGAAAAADATDALSHTRHHVRHRGQEGPGQGRGGGGDAVRVQARLRPRKRGMKRREKRRAGKLAGRGPPVHVRKRASHGGGLGGVRAVRAGPHARAQGDRRRPQPRVRLALLTGVALHIQKHGSINGLTPVWSSNQSDTRE